MYKPKRNHFKFFVVVYIALVLMISVNAFGQSYFQGNNLIEVPTSTTTAAGTTTLVRASQTNQMFTGATTQTVVLPDATTLQVGRRFYITNRSTGVVTVNYNGGTLAKTMQSNTQATFILKSNGSTAGSWDVSNDIINLTSGVTGILPIANGGTNSGTVLSNNRVMQSSAGAIVEAPVITASRALASDVNGIPVASLTTATELGYVNGVTSSIQTQLNAKAPTGNYITSLTGDATASGPGAAATTVTRINGQSLAALGTGILKNTTGTGVPSIAIAADFPTLNQNTTGTAANVTGTVAIANGGTGQTTKAAAFDALSPMTTGGDLIYGGASGTGTRLANGSSGQYLTSSGGTTAPTWTTGNPLTTNGDMIYGVGSTPTRLAAGTSNQILKSNGAAAPSWVGAGTIPNSVITPQSSGAQLTWAIIGPTGTVVSSSGAWISSINYSSTGTYGITLNSGIFASAFGCGCMTQYDGYGTGTCTYASNNSATFIQIRTFNQAGSDSDRPFMIVCGGPR